MIQSFNGPSLTWNEFVSKIRACDIIKLDTHSNGRVNIFIRHLKRERRDTFTAFGVRVISIMTTKGKNTSYGNPNVVKQNLNFY